ALVRADGQRCSAPVAIRAIPATTVPITEPVTRFQNIHGGPQPGVASAMTVTGNIAITPHSGPRRNHLPGQEVMPTRKPISSRALWNAHTATAPRMPSTLNLYGIGPCTRA